MLPFKEMHEYVRQGILRYEADKERYGKTFEHFDEFDRRYLPEQLLLQYGWLLVIGKPYRRDKYAILPEYDTYRSYYSQEYDLRIDLYFNEHKLVWLDWFVNDNSPIQQYEVTAFTLYCVLRYGGNIKAAVKGFVFSQHKKEIYSSLLEKFDIKENENVTYQHPPQPIAIQPLSKQESVTGLDILSDKLSNLEKKIASLQPNRAVNSSTPSTKITDSISSNQADGRYNQEYSQAHYTFLNECNQHHYFNNTGIPIGYHCDTPHSPANKFKNNLIYYQGETHLITIAPTGSGKLTAVQIPVLMEYTGSMVVIDPKGQCAAISARQRRKLGQKVIIINPFDILKEEFEKIGITEFQGCNPLALLNKKDDNFVADVSALAEALVVGDDVGNSDPYWSNSARDLIACLIMYVCCSDKEENKRHLPRVRELLTLDSESLAEKMMEISKDKFKPMAQKAMRFTREESSNASVISTAISNTLFLDDPKLIANLEKDDFRFDSLKTNEKTTVYIILPAKFLLAYSQWFRLLITSGLDTLMSTHKKADKNVLFMLDEFPTLGRLSSIETAIGLARGYGIQIWMFLQDIHQLNHLYKDKAESFLANTGMQQYFTPNDIVTAERISRRMGNTTLIDEKVTRELSAWGIDMNNMPTNVEISHKERPLNYPIEILSFHKDIQLVFFSGNANVVVMDKNYYYDVGNYRENGIPLYNDDPYYNA